MRIPSFFFSIIVLSACAGETQTVDAPASDAKRSTIPTQTDPCEVCPPPLTADGPIIAPQAVSLEQFGGKADGITDNSLSLSKALSSLGTTGGRVQFGAGIYRFQSTVDYSFPSKVRQHVSLRGMGVDATTLVWSGIGLGVHAVLDGPYHSIDVADMSFETTRAGDGTAIQIDQLMLLGNITKSTFTNLVFRGSDSQQVTSYWGTAILVNAVSNIDFEKLTMISNSAQGIGVSIQGNPNIQPQYGIVYNFRSSEFFGGNINILYGGYIQGVTITQCNFTNGQVGVQSNAGEGGALAQLAISDSQFNTYGAGQIVSLTGIDQLMLTNNLFFVPDNQFGVYMPANYFVAIANNTFTGGSHSTAIYLDATGSDNAGIITGNVFHSFGVGVSLAANSRGITVVNNSYSLVTTQAQDSGSNNSVGKVSP